MVAKITCISFDVWNTLLKLEPVYEALAEQLGGISGRRRDDVLKALYEAGREARHRRRRSGFLTVDETLEVLASHLDTSLPLIRHAIAKTFASIDARRIVVEDALNVLKEVKGLGLRVAVAGNVLWWPGWYTRLVLAKAGLLDYIDESVFADELEESKPSPRFFETVASRLGCTIRELVHVGDRVDEDFAGALAAGAYAILVNSEVKPQTIVKLSRRAYAVPKITDIPQLIKELRG